MDGRQVSFKRNLLDQNFDLEKAYFFKDISDSQWTAIKTLINSYFKENKAKIELRTFFQSYSALKKGAKNVKQLRSLIDEIAGEHKNLPNFFESYKNLNNFVSEEFMIAKPAVLQTYFFPNEANEVYLINMLRTVKHSLDIAIFTLTNDKIFAAVEEVWNEGVEVRIITDDDCTNQIGSDIFKLASMVRVYCYLLRGCR